ncbi:MULTISPECIES: hypothetical protein [Burkholderia]|uniref:hypothetical protein n=1 Tax=Burkholderia sp. MS455 TaxID=2811788 RepID=UPI001EF47977|nr:MULTISPECIES: hypothetical protein [Burkholderia]
MEYFGGATLRALGEQRSAIKRRTDAIAVLEAVLVAMRETHQGLSHVRDAEPAD